MNPDSYSFFGFAVMGFALKAVILVTTFAALAGLIGGFCGGRLALRNVHTRKPIVGALFSVGFSLAWTLVILGMSAKWVLASMSGVFFPIAIPAMLIGALFGAWVTSRGNLGQN